MLTFVLEAALRSLLMALAVWTTIRLLRVQAVLAQKVAWVLVLLAAGLMPLVMHAPGLALNRAVRIPMRSFSVPALLARWRASHPATAPQVSLSVASAAPRAGALAHLPKPPATHIVMRSAAPFVEHPALRIDDIDTPFMTRAVSTPIPSAVRALPLAAITTAAPAYWSLAHIRLWAFILYLGIGGLLLLRTLAGAAIALRIVQRAKPITLVQGDASTVVRISPDLTTPVTIGSTVVLPADCRHWDAAKLRVVLAHEQSHVRQRDFYLQLLAAIHAAVFWFSPLGWWLKRKLTELGEALSDRAALEQASDAASYAQVLLEFAAMPHRTPIAGVAMARSSNLSSRIERILNDRRFRLAFLGGRRHAVLTALIVPAALVAVVACIRIVPAVHAAQVQPVVAVNPPAALAPPAPVTLMVAPEAGQIAPKAVAQAPAPVEPASPVIAPDPVVEVEARVAPEVDTDVDTNVEVQDAVDVQTDVAPKAPGSKHGTHVWINNGDHDNIAIVHENGDGTLQWNGEYNNDLARIRSKMKLKGDYIWYERDGKSYVITDPALVAKAQQLFKGDPELDRQMKMLEDKQKVWEKKMHDLEPEMEKAKIPGPEFAAQMAKLNTQLAELQSDKFKKMTDQMSKEFSEERIAELQEKVGEIQSQIGEIQGRIGERQGEIGEKQGAIGEKMGELGEQMGRIGEKQGAMAEEASRKLKSLLDQSIRDGNVKPVE